MAVNGDSVLLLAQELFEPLNAGLDYLFYAGTLYGARHVLGFVYDFLRGLRTYVLPFGRCCNSDLTKQFGKWAVITGATSGIGLAYAHEFAKRGMNVVLISRSYDDLVQIVSDLQSMYSVQAYGIHADFSLGTRVFQEIEEALQGYEIGILVNNVAICYDHPQYFVLVPPQRVWQLINVNIAGTTVMTHMLLPQMLERKRGAIINVCSSVSCVPPIPLTTGYTATMAYVSSFSQALHCENRHRGIIVQTLVPCFVATEEMAPSFFTPASSTYVRHAIKTLGVSTYTCGYWPHALQTWLCSLLPSWLWVKVVTHINSVLRKRYLYQAMEQGTRPMFARKRHSSAGGSALQWYQPGRRTSGLSMRRTPSPSRKLSSVEPPDPTLHIPIHRPTMTSTADPLRRVSIEENAVFTPIRTSSGASYKSMSPIVETPSPTHSPLTPGTPRSSSSLAGIFANGTSSRVSAGDQSPVQPRRSSSASSVESGFLHRRHTLPKKLSRVLVVPSVARVSQSPDKEHDTSGKMDEKETFSEH